MSDASTPMPAPGWYADPQNSSQIRYWDGARWTSQVRALPGEPAESRLVEPASGDSAPEILVVTSDQVPGQRIIKVIGEVTGVAVRARNVYANVGASFRTMAGGEAAGYASMLLDSRQEAVARMKAAARAAGANAVVAARQDSGDIAGLMSEVAAYGTAVVVESE